MLGVRIPIFWRGWFLSSSVWAKRTASPPSLLLLSCLVKQWTLLITLVHESSTSERAENSACFCVCCCSADGCPIAQISISCMAQLCFCLFDVCVKGVVNLLIMCWESLTSTVFMTLSQRTNSCAAILPSFLKRSSTSRRMDMTRHQNVSTHIFWSQNTFSACTDFWRTSSQHRRNQKEIIHQRRHEKSHPT